MRLLKRILGIGLVTMLLVVLGGFLYLRSSLPTTTGTLTLPGLKAEVEVWRDSYGVPHIFADNDADAFYALGFVHAQDRLSQMEFQRRVGTGRLSEILGEGTLNTDRFLRTLGVYHAAQKSVEHLDQTTLDALTAYTQGVNSYLTHHKGALPPEFLLLGVKPEPWQITDSLVWSKMMAWDLAGNWDDELLRARLMNQLSSEQVTQFFPPYPGDAPIALPDFKALYNALPLDEIWATSPKPLPPGSGSNNWALSPEHSTSGGALLANDPHLGLQAPALWYFAHLKTPELNVIGATLPGLPFVVLGRNDHIAWGFTNTGPDTQDLFIEQLMVNEPNSYYTPDGIANFELRQEVIDVKGRDEPVEITVRIGRHGPIISDVEPRAQAVAEQQEIHGNYALAFAWTSLQDDDLTVQAGLNLNRATDWESFKEALRDFHSPQQNIAFADTQGNIGMIAPARVPLRNNGDGLVPVPGWSDTYDWNGFIPFEELPQSFNPASGQIVTANHKIIPESYPYFITHDWSEPYRAQRIEALLAAQEQHDLDSMARVQLDQVSLMAQTFLPLLKETPPQSELAHRILDRVRNWDGDMAADSPEPLIFSVWYQAFSRLVYQDDLGEALFEEAWGFRPIFLHEVITQNTAWCDDKQTLELETCLSISALALEQAARELPQAHGADIRSWRWGNAHIAYHDHDVMTHTPLRRFFDIKNPYGGDAFTVNAARYAIDDPYIQTSGPSYRALFDLSDLQNSRMIHTTGQSGNPLSRHYHDLNQLWAHGKSIATITDKALLAEQNPQVLTLIPQTP